MKKRYGKFFAYIFAGSVAGCVNFLWISIFAISSSGSTISLSNTLPWLAVFTVATVLLSILLLKNVPKGERLGVWLRCFWLGFKISLKITLFITIVLIGAARSIDTGISDKDVYNPDDDWYREGKRVRDNDGNEFTVGRSGDYVKDKEGNWHKVNLEKGERFAVIGNEKRKLY